jgi:hypothetical protein
MQIALSIILNSPLNLFIDKAIMKNIRFYRNNSKDDL